MVAGGSSGGSKESPMQQFLMSLVAGGGAGAISKTCVAPLERIKIILQVQQMQKTAHGQYASVGDALKGILKNEGVRAYWKGNYMNCIRIVPVAALKFTLFDKFKVLLLPEGKKFDGLELWARKLLAGGLSGACMQCCVQPLAVVMTRLAADQGKGESKAFNGIIDCFTKTYKLEGAKGLYRGLAPAVAGIVPYLGVTFSTFDTLKLFVPVGKDGKHGTVATMAMGGLSGLFAQTLVFPLDTVRNRMQVDGQKGSVQKYNGTLDCFKQIKAQEGIKGFYRGVTTNAYKAVPSVAIEFYMFDRLKTLFFAASGQQDKASHR